MPKRPPKSSRSLGGWISDTWALEVAALLLGIASLAAIIILLSIYDGKPQFSFGFLNLNTVIAILATAFRIGFMVPVGEALAQWKWLWFSRTARPLGDFDSIDDASRGSRGSLLLLWETKGLSLTAIGAWVTILSLATEPFIQQLVTFRETVVFQNSSSVQIPFAQRWDGATELPGSPETSSSDPTGNNLTTVVSEYGTVSNVQLDQAAQAAAQFGLNSNVAAVAAQLPVKCPSGNCTWPPFLSLAVCSRCFEVSDMLKSASEENYPMGYYWPFEAGFEDARRGQSPNQLTSYYLPNGLNLNNRRAGEDMSASPVVATALVDFHPSTSLMFHDATTLLFSTSIIRVPDSSFPVGAVWPESSVTVEAAECGLYLCVKEFNSHVESGNLIESSREVASERDPDSFTVQVSCEGPCGTLDFRGVDAEVDALFSNTTYFPRTDLTIKVPTGVSSTNNLRSVNVTQEGIDGISEFISSLFDQGTFRNVTLSGVDEEGCSFNGSPAQCNVLKNISGMAVGETGRPNLPIGAQYFSPAVMEQIWGSPNLSTTFENLATSLTNSMRQHHADQNSGVTGQLGSLRTVLQVRWEWIALPVFLFLVSLVFFLLTTIESRRTATPLWKGSALAVLYHGLETKVRDTLEHWDLPSQMSDSAEEVSVRLRRDALHDALLLRTGPDKTQSMRLMNTSNWHRPSIADEDDDIDGESSQIHLTHAQTAPEAEVHGH